MGVGRAPKGFAVVDFETTGINPARGDRAIEVGIVHVAPDGTLEDEAETLIRVQGDLGAQSLHHIHAADLIDAPDFAGIAAELRDRLDGYVFVAHNAVFDSRFLNAEYGRLGYVTPVDRSTSICTLRLSSRYLGLRSLDDCCHELGIRNPDAHSALGDAHATALLLSGFLAGLPDWEGWRPALQSAADHEWPRIDERRHAWMPRQTHAAAKRPASAFLDRLQSRNPAAQEVDDADGTMRDAASEYVGLLDMCLVDARLTDHEKTALSDMAEALRLSDEDRRAIHENYFADIAEEAWIDGALSAEEERELRQVGDLLSIDPAMVEYALTDRGHAESGARHARRGDGAVAAFDGRRLDMGPDGAIPAGIGDGGARPDDAGVADSGSETDDDGTGAGGTGDGVKKGKGGGKTKDAKGRKKHKKHGKHDDDPNGVTLGRTIKRVKHDRKRRERNPHADDMAGFRLRRGDRVVVAGPLRRPVDEWIYRLEGLGLVAWPTVTEQVRLVVAPEPDGDSPITRQAREFGVPVVDEQWLDAAVGAGLVDS